MGCREKSLEDRQRDRVRRRERVERREGGGRRADEGGKRNGRYVERRKPEAGREGTEG